MKNFTTLTEKELLLVEGGFGAGIVNTDAVAANSFFNSTGTFPFFNNVLATNNFASANGDVAAFGTIGAAGAGQSAAANSLLGNISFGSEQFIAM